MAVQGILLAAHESDFPVAPLAPQVQNFADSIMEPRLRSHCLVIDLIPIITTGIGRPATQFITKKVIGDTSPRERIPEQLAIELGSILARRCSANIANRRYLIGLEKRRKKTNLQIRMANRIKAHGKITPAINLKQYPLKGTRLRLMHKYGFRITTDVPIFIPWAFLSVTSAAGSVSTSA